MSDDTVGIIFRNALCAVVGILVAQGLWNRFMPKSKKPPLALLLALAFASAPIGASAQVVPVFDAVAGANAVRQIGQYVTELQQTLSIMQSARANLQQLPSGIGMSNIVGRISAVTGIIQQAQSLCQNPEAAARLRVCRVQANTAQAQAAQLGSEMAQVQALQFAANGVGGGLASTQLIAKAAVENALQLQELRQATTATQTQAVIDQTAAQHTAHGASSFGPGYVP